MVVTVTFLVAAIPATIGYNYIDQRIVDRLGPGTVQASSMLLNEIGNSYAVEQLGQFSDNGTVRRKYWSPRMWEQIGDWFVTNGISISEDSISG